MSDPPISAEPDPGEAELRLQLARGDAMASSALPVLHHLLSTDRHALFAEEIIARLRGMLAGLAGELLGSDQPGQGVLPSEPPADGPGHAAIIARLRVVPGLISHLHALALEYQLTERAQVRLGIDPVLSPLLQALVAATDGATSAVAMKLLAAQARFLRGQRRMQTTLNELAPELLHGVLSALREADGGIIPAATERAIAAGYDESATRLGLLARLVAAMNGGATAALALPHAGLPIFITALAQGLERGRDGCVLLLDAGQAIRLALSLRTLGIKPAVAIDTVLSLNPSAHLPGALDSLRSERAAALLHGDHDPAAPSWQ